MDIRNSDAMMPLKLIAKDDTQRTNTILNDICGHVRRVILGALFHALVESHFVRV